MTGLRFALASAVLLPYTLWRRVLPRGNDLPLFFLVGFLTVPATFLVQFWGLSLTSVSTAALIMGCGPPMIALFACVFLGERLGGRGWAAVGASTLGVALTVARPGAGGNWLGDALVLVSLLAVVGGCFWASGSTKDTRRWRPPRGYSPSARWRSRLIRSGLSHHKLECRRASAPHDPSC